MYGGEWYNKKVAIWGEPSEKDLTIAKRMQERCRAALSGEPTTKTNEPVAEPVAAPKKRVFKVIEQPQEQQTVAAVAAAFFVPRETPKVRKMKVVKQEPVQPSFVQPLAVESTESPLIVGDLDEDGKEIILKTISVKKTYVPPLGRECFIDADSGDAYEIDASGGVGKKIEDDDY
jgi:hypothetical protein